jgi:hypothetical protein
MEYMDTNVLKFEVAHVGKESNGSKGQLKWTPESRPKSTEFKILAVYILN